MDIAAALGLAALLFVKEAGVPIPIPGDLLVLGAGVASAGNPAGAVVALVTILVAGYLGGVVPVRARPRRAAPATARAADPFRRAARALTRSRSACAVVARAAWRSLGRRLASASRR